MDVQDISQENGKDLSKGEKNVHTGHRLRLKKQMLSMGLANFHDHNILELLLFYAVPLRDTNPLAHKLIEEFGSLRRVFDATYADLLKVDGVGENIASLIKMVPELSRAYLERGTPEQAFIRNTTDAYVYVAPYFVDAQQERVVLVCLDNKHGVIDAEILFEGSVNSAEINIRKILERVIRNNAAAVVLAHNHPGGYSVPSRMDMETTKRVVEALKAISVRLLDHIIVTEEECKKYLSQDNSPNSNK